MTAAARDERAVLHDEAAIPVSSTDWLDANRRNLMSAIAELGEALERFVAGEPARPRPIALPVLQPPPAHEALAQAFALSPFEHDVLLLCAGVELSARFATQCRAAAGGSHPTFALALAAVPGAHWSACAPSSPLRRHRLIELRGAGGPAHAPIAIDERVLHHLVGVDYLDERLAPILREVASPRALPPSQRRIADALAARWSDGEETAPIQLCGPDATTCEVVAASAAAALGLPLHLLRAADLPAGAVEREALGRLWEREARLGAGALLVACEAEQAAAAIAFVERLSGPVALAGTAPLGGGRGVLRLDVARPTAGEQRDLWSHRLGPHAADLHGPLDTLIAHFDLGAHAIDLAAGRALDPLADSDLAGTTAERLWHACRAQARGPLDDLARRIDPAAGWDDLVVGEEARGVLREIEAHVRHRARVHGAWGFGRQGERGLGTSALFAGASGTGKTMAAEVLAAALSLDLYRIDLSQVVSKYIGETEKNLRRVFDAAEQGGAILLFDEADALFGKRSEVKDSHDRYANIEISYLLSRMETYRGLSILTTNHKNALDPAFLRRIRFAVHFAFPDEAERAELWRRAFPKDAPTAGLDPARLARLHVTGGSIRNIALAAAFLAADEGEPVRMRHARAAAIRECAKLERALSDAEIEGWT